MLWYNVGKVAVTLNSKTVTGTGTAWLANVRNGDAFRGPDGQIYLVENVATNTSLSIAPAYGSTSGTGKDYAIVPVQGYQRDLADQVVELIGTYGALGTAAAATLSTSTIDPVAGRVMRNADWGFGGVNGVAADTNILNNTVNGIYRSGSSDVGKPDGYTAGSYFRMGWGSTHYGLLYNSPITDKWHVRTVNSGAANSWKELMTVGLFGIGSSGASSSSDLWPTSTVDDTGVPSGNYWLNSTIGGRPPVVGSYSSVVWHRQVGSAGGQLIVSSNNRLIWRGRNASNYQPYREALAVNDFGLGGYTVNPPNGRDGVNPFGWYYRSSPTPTWGGGSFFLDMPYSSNMNAGLRLSTDPYTDDFYLNGGVSGQKEYRPACKLVHDKNIVGDVTAGSVIATGSNANGTWVRFADGTQICRGQVTFSGNSWKPSSPVIAYPMAFIVPPTTVLQPMTDGSGYYAVPQMGMGSGAVSFFIRDTPGITDTGTSAAVAYVAIGVWK